MSTSIFTADIVFDKDGNPLPTSTPQEETHAVDAPMQVDQALPPEELQQDGAASYLVTREFAYEGIDCTLEVQCQINNKPMVAQMFANSIDSIFSNDEVMAGFIEAQGDPKALVTALRKLVPLEAQSELREISKDDAAHFLSQQVGVPPSDVFDALAQALAYQALDPILSKIAHRDRITKIASQLSKAIQGLSLIGETMKLEIDESPVQATPNFALYDGEELQALVTAAVVKASKYQNEIDNLKDANKVQSELLDRRQTTIENTTSLADMATVTLKEANNDALEKIKYLNVLLSRYHSMPHYIVAKMDSVTRKPLRYAILHEDDTLTTTKLVANATITPDLASARKLRRLMWLREYDMLAKRSVKLSMSDKEAIRDTWAVMQSHIQEVDLYEEE